MPFKILEENEIVKTFDSSSDFVVKSIIVDLYSDSNFFSIKSW